MHSIKILCLTILTVAFMSLASMAQDAIIGSWSGDLKIGINKLGLVLNFEKDGDGKMECLLDSPDQGVKGIETKIEYIDRDSVSILVPTIGASYNGRVSGAVMTGTFRQSGMAFDLTLKPGRTEKIRPQTPKPPYPYQTREVTISNDEDKVMLSGTLTYPINFSAKTDVPMVVMVSGSGQQDRDESTFEHKPFLVLADYLARHGVASLRYDDRGVGKSTGDVASVTLQSNARDAVAVLNYAKGLNTFGKIGLLGHSEGGLIAFMIGGQHPRMVDFIISLAGSAVRGDSILISQNRTMLSTNAPKAFADSYCSVLKSILAYKIAHKKVDNATQVVDSLTVVAHVDLPQSAKENLEKILVRNSPWLDSFIAYNPAQDISKISCPVMAINGTRDMQVMTADNLNAIRTLLHADRHNFVREYPGLNHLFQHCTTGSPAEYGHIEETISEKVMNDIATWIVSLK